MQIGVVIGVLLAGVFGFLWGPVLARTTYEYSVPSGPPRTPCSHCGAERAEGFAARLRTLTACGECRNRLGPPAWQLGAAAGVLCLLTAWRFGTDPAIASFLALALLAVPLAAIDLAVFRLPDAIVYPLYVIGAAGLAIAAVIDNDEFAIVRAVIGLVLLRGYYSLLHRARPSDMGLGDVKLAGVLGMYLGWLGWSALAIGAFTGFALAAAFAVPKLLAGEANRKSQLPFGPFMLGGAFIGILLSGSVTLFG